MLSGPKFNKPAIFNKPASNVCNKETNELILAINSIINVKIAIVKKTALRTTRNSRDFLASKISERLDLVNKTPQLLSS